MKEMILKKNSVRTSIPCDVMVVCRELSFPSLFSSPFHFFDLFSSSPCLSVTHSLTPSLPHSLRQEEIAALSGPDEFAEFYC